MFLFTLFLQIILFLTQYKIKKILQNGTLQNFQVIFSFIFRQNDQTREKKQLGLFKKVKIIQKNFIFEWKKRIRYFKKVESRCNFLIITARACSQVLFFFSIYSIYKRRTCVIRSCAHKTSVYGTVNPRIMLLEFKLKRMKHYFSGSI